MQTEDDFRAALLDVIELLKSLGIHYRDHGKYIEYQYSYKRTTRFKAQIFALDRDTVLIVAPYHPNPTSPRINEGRVQQVGRDETAYREWTETIHSRPIHGAALRLSENKLVWIVEATTRLTISRDHSEDETQLFYRIHCIAQRFKYWAEDIHYGRELGLVFDNPHPRSR